MGNRPINRRPWRRAPWRKSIRPKRWNASSTAATESLWDSVALLSTAGFGSTEVPPIITLVDGELDVQPWSDDEEVRLDRIVGDLNFRCNYLASPAPLIVVRLGLLVTTFDEPTGDVMEIDISAQSEMENQEWVWLRQFTMEPVQIANAQGSIVQVGWHDEHLDIRNRRKLGHRDQLVMYGQWGVHAGGSSGDFANVTMCHNLRTVLVGK